MCRTDANTYYTGQGKVELKKNVENIDQKVLKILENEPASQLDVFYIRKKINEIHELTNEVLSALKDHLNEEGVFQKKMIDMMNIEVGNGEKCIKPINLVAKSNYDNLRTIRDFITIIDRIKRHKVLLFLIGFTIFLFNNQISKVFKLLLEYVNIDSVINLFS